MITSIHGTLAAASPLLAVVEINGLGYEVNIPVTTAERLPATEAPCGSIPWWFTGRIPRRSMVFPLQRSGFFPAADREGDRRRPQGRTQHHEPALAPLLRNAIATGDVATLAKCPGLAGRRRNAWWSNSRDNPHPPLNLPRRCPVPAAPRPAAPHSQRDAVMALMALGYKAADADKMVRQAWIGLGPSATTEQLLKKALG